MKEAVKTLQKWTDSWVIGKTEYMWDGGSDEDLDAIHASIRAVLAAIEIRDEAPDNSTKSTPIKTNVNRCEPWTHVWVKSPELTVSCDVCGISISEAVDK